MLYEMHCIKGEFLCNGENATNNGIHNLMAMLLFCLVSQAGNLSPVECNTYKSSDTVSLDGKYSVPCLCIYSSQRQEVKQQKRFNCSSTPSIPCSEILFITLTHTQEKV